MDKRVLACTILSVLGMGFWYEAAGQANPNQLVAQRKGAMNLQAKYFGPILGMARGRVPFDARLAQRNADYLALLSQMPWDDFQPATANVPNARAKEAVYSDSVKFKQAAETMQSEVQKLASTARGGDQGAIKTAAFSVARSCNSCHESFATFEFRFPVE